MKGRCEVGRRWRRVVAHLALVGLAGCERCSEPTSPNEPVTVRLSSADVQFPSADAPTQTISATTIDRFGRPTSDSVAWLSSDTRVVTIAADGRQTAVIKGIGSGTAIITATAGTSFATASVKVSCLVTLGSPQPASTLAVLAGLSQRIIVPVVASAGCSTALSWRSSASAVAIVDSGGTVTAIAPGTTVITAQSKQDPQLSAAVTVTVQRVNRVSLAQSDTLRVGSSRALAAQTDPTGVALRWSSSDTAVANVDSSTGVVTGVSDGNTLIRATSVADPTISGALLLRVVGRVSAVQVSASTDSVDVGKSLAFSATVTGDVGIDRSVLWSSGALAVARVDSTGIVTGVRHGVGSVCATSRIDSLKFDCMPVRVFGRVFGIAVAPSNVSVKVGRTTQLTATVTADSGVATLVRWSTSNDAVATVTTGGLVTAKAKGQVTISATSVADGSKTAHAVVIVDDIQVQISPRSQSVAIGGSAAFTANVSGPHEGDTRVLWSSSDPTTLAVTVAGQAQGIKTGSAYVKATSAFDPTAADSVLVSVVPCTVTSISATPSSVSLRPGSTQQLVVSPAGCSGAVSVVATSSNAGVASVSGTLLVSAVARGKATITLRLAANPSVLTVVSVQVNDVSGLAVSPSPDSIRPTWTRQLVATVTADSGVPTSVTWSSSNQAVATVSASGVVKGVSLGTAVITARSDANPSFVATSSIRVGDGCTVPLTISIGSQVASSIVGPQVNCGGDSEIWSWSAASRAFILTVDAPFQYEFRPVFGPGTTTWYYPSVVGKHSVAVVASGRYLSQITAHAGATGPVSLAATSWNPATTCFEFFATTGIQLRGSPLDATCATDYQPPGTTGVFYSQKIDMAPYAVAGDQLTIAVTASGFEPRIHVQDGGVHRVGAVAAPGVSQLTVQHVAVGGNVEIFVSSRTPGATGRYDISIAGPTTSYRVGGGVISASSSGANATSCATAGCAVPASPRTPKVLPRPVPVNRLAPVRP